MSTQSAKEFAMRCTAMVLSVMVFTSACRADAPQASSASGATSPPPATPPSQWAQPNVSSSPRARTGGGVGGGPLIVDGDNGWMMLRRPATSRPTEKGPYLGLAVSSVPTVVRDQLNLKKNVGLVVNFVEKDSPAEAAGFKPSDILQKLDDQILIDTRQFAVLVRIHDVNQPVRFTIIRQAKAMEINAKLVEKDLAVLDESGRSGAPSPWDLYLDARRDSVADEAVNRANEATNRAVEQLQRRLEQMNRSSSRTFGLESKDDQHTFKISDANGHRTLKASDNNGKMIYEGPIDTDEQMDQLPVEIKEKVKKLPMVWGGHGLMTTQPFRVMPAVPAVPRAPATPATPAAPAVAPRPVTPTAAAGEPTTY